MTEQKEGGFSKRISRRQFLQGMGGIVAGVFLGGCEEEGSGAFGVHKESIKPFKVLSPEEEKEIERMWCLGAEEKTGYNVERISKIIFFKEPTKVYGVTKERYEGKTEDKDYSIFLKPFLGSVWLEVENEKVPVPFLGYPVGKVVTKVSDELTAFSRKVEYLIYREEDLNGEIRRQREPRQQFLLICEKNIGINFEPIKFE